MHELGLAASISEIALETLRLQNAEVPLRVGRVCVRIGDLAGVDPEALLFGWEVVREERVETAGAALVIERCPARVRCLECGRECEFTGEGTSCAGCGALGRNIISGRELEVRRIELEEEVA